MQPFKRSIYSQLNRPTCKFALFHKRQNEFLCSSSPSSSSAFCGLFISGFGFYLSCVLPPSILDVFNSQSNSGQHTHTSNCKCNAVVFFLFFFEEEEEEEIKSNFSNAGFELTFGRTHNHSNQTILALFNYNLRIKKRPNLFKNGLSSMLFHHLSQCVCVIRIVCRNNVYFGDLVVCVV